MRFTYKWLKDFADIRVEPEALADKLTMAGLEITSFVKRNGDFVFEAEVTSNRPDWLSVAGIAREAAAVTGAKLKFDQGGRRKQKSPSPLTLEPRPFSIKVENKKDCPLYTARIISGIKVRLSPAWLRQRLELIGCRSVNNVADVTNYILFSWGQPLHAFDLDKLQGNSIFIRRAKNGEKIVVIDGEEKRLTPQDIVIADSALPAAIAGIMGGRGTEITEETKNILLESAVFNPALVRASRQRLGLGSESSYRFERGIDSRMTDIASSKAAELIQELAGGEYVFAASRGGARLKNKMIGLNTALARQSLGVEIAKTKIKKILEGLGLKVEIKGREEMIVVIPSWRPDLSSEMDLIEEIARIFGYENIPKTLPRINPRMEDVIIEDPVSVLRSSLVGLGLNEVVTHSMVSKEALASFGIAEDDLTVEIFNPLSREQEVLRPKLIPSLAFCVADNLNQRQEHIGIFEVARVFEGPLDKAREELRLGVAVCGTNPFLFEQGLVLDNEGFLHLKGVLTELFEKLGVAGYSFKPSNAFAINIYAGKDEIGRMVKLERHVLDKLNIKGRDVFLLEVSLEKLFSFVQFERVFKPLPKFPGISRNISFVLKKDIAAGDVLEAIRSKGQPLLQKAEIVDCYQGEQIPEGYRGLSVCCFYRSDERTLTEEEITSLHNSICDALIEGFSIKIR